jgi:hypothetical protein
VDELVVHGPAEACVERVASYVSNGLDTPILAVLPAGDVKSPEAVRALARRS